MSNLTNSNLKTINNFNQTALQYYAELKELCGSKNQKDTDAYELYLELDAVITKLKETKKLLNTINTRRITNDEL